MRTPGWLAAVLLAMAAPALAHEGGVDARGTVATADGGHVALRGPDGEEHRFALTPKTRILVEGRAAQAADLKPGLRAVVHGRKAGGRLEAAEVRAAAPKGPETDGPAKRR